MHHNRTTAFLLSVLIATLLVSCAEQPEQPPTKTASPLTQAWKDYWYSGTAELNRYELAQSRYGEVRNGEAVLIFVTEDFLTDQQTKYERGPKDKVASVLKMNHTSKFWTGVYPYSMISSVFSPVAGSPTLKVACSVQEWCGHSYSQLNLRDQGYEGTLHSYFQAEADQDFNLEQVMLEDEIWTQIRMRPNELPEGEIRLVPGSQFLRLRHRDFSAETARASKTAFEDLELSPKALTKYRIEYQGFKRSLEITYETEFPHAILAWEEDSGRGPATRAVLTHSIKSPYWGQNAVADSTVRKQLGLEYN